MLWWHHGSRSVPLSPVEAFCALVALSVVSSDLEIAALPQDMGQVVAIHKFLSFLASFQKDFRDYWGSLRTSSSGSLGASTKSVRNPAGVVMDRPTQIASIYKRF